jgi:outer membrane protein TolC
MKQFEMKRWVAGICLAAGAFAPAMAQDSLRLNLDRVLEIALSDNPTIQVANRELEIKQYAKKETITGLFPTISVSGTASDAIVQQKMKLSFSPDPITMGQQYTYALSGTVALPLVAPQLWKTISLNEEEVQLAVESARSSKVSTISEVKNAYYSLLLARDSYEALDANYKTSQMNAQTVAAKYNQGTVSEYDKLVADVQVASIKPQLLNSSNGIKLAEMQLKVLMGVDVNEPIIFEGKLSDYEEQLFADLMTLKSDTALTDNSALRQLDIQARQLKLAEKINKLGYIPTLALSFTTGYQAYAEEFNPFDAQYFGNATLALSLNWTLFDGGAKYMKTKQNNLSIRNVETQRENLVRQLELSVSNSLNSIETSAEQVVSNKENVYSAERAYSISQKRYDIGSGTLLEMTSSETSLLSARLQYVQSIYDFLSARASLEATLGKLVTDK